MFLLSVFITSATATMQVASFSIPVYRIDDQYNPKHPKRIAVLHDNDPSPEILINSATCRKDGLRLRAHTALKSFEGPYKRFLKVQQPIDIKVKVEFDEKAGSFEIENAGKTAIIYAKSSQIPKVSILEPGHFATVSAGSLIYIKDHLFGVLNPATIKRIAPESIPLDSMLHPANRLEFEQRAEMELKKRTFSENPLLQAFGAADVESPNYTVVESSRAPVTVTDAALLQHLQDKLMKLAYDQTSSDHISEVPMENPLVSLCAQMDCDWNCLIRAFYILQSVQAALPSLSGRQGKAVRKLLTYNIANYEKLVGTAIALSKKAYESDHHDFSLTKLSAILRVDVRQLKELARVILKVVDFKILPRDKRLEDFIQQVTAELR